MAFLLVVSPLLAEDRVGNTHEPSAVQAEDDRAFSRRYAANRQLESIRADGAL